ncbi:hypothetical protein NFI96_016044 [Prochilodus magdalenae]|nr:hypothetical protein NFI96_016044 [Prochilodus magdalenae]
MVEMKGTSISLLVATFILAAALASAQENKPPATVAPPARFGSTSQPTTNTTIITTTANATTTTISQNTTTPHANVTTTTASHNTTAHTNATTIAPTTHNATTANTTTPHTVPTTTQKPEPTPPTNLTIGNYTIKDGNNLCIMVQTILQVSVNNSHADGKYIVQPNAVKVTGSCKANTSSIKMTLKEGSISLSFEKNGTTNKVYVNNVAINLNYVFKSGVQYNFTKTNKSVQLFSMEAGHSYSCKSESVFLGEGVSLDFSQQRIQAFDFSSNQQFGPVDLCKADQPNYSVAIAVGVVLLILIIIVVIAYLISRRKRTDGYQSL